MRSIGCEVWRHCYGVLAVVAVGGLTVVGCGSSDASLDEISKAARAPYIAIVRRDAHALCADFTPMAADYLARDVLQSVNCEERVAESFVRSAPFEPKSQPVALNAFKVSGVTLHDNVASAVVAYGAGGSGVQVTLELIRVGGAWRIASHPALSLVNGCYTSGVLTENCPTSARVMLFSIGKPELRSERSGGTDRQQLVPVPPAVEDTGGSELREFDAGMKVAAQAGCLACHRIGEQGNAGPGPDLTHIGSTLSERQIEHAIIDPSAPMPPFKNLPREKLTAIVDFLSRSQLRKP
jgi:Cytochrome C oxidase, cbb3-type, subunit III